jgi:hypothetical protein
MVDFDLPLQAKEEEEEEEGGYPMLMTKRIAFWCISKILQ